MSDRVDEITESFIRTMKDKPWSEEAETAALDFAKSLKQIGKNHSPFLIAELAETLSSVKNVALISDEDMLLHKPCAGIYDEIPERLERILSKLEEEKIWER